MPEATNQSTTTDATTPPPSETNTKASTTQVMPEGVKNLDAYEKVLIEKRNAMAKARELEEKLERLETERLKEKEDYKAMYEMSQKKLKEYETVLATEKENKTRAIKLTAVKKEFEKMGLKDSQAAETLFPLIDINTLKYDEEHSVVLGAEDEARRIKERLPQVFGAGTSTARAAHDAPTGTTGAITLDAWKKMSPQDRKKYEPELYKSMGVNFRK